MASVLMDARLRGHDEYYKLSVHRKLAQVRRGAVRAFEQRPFGFTGGQPRGHLVRVELDADGVLRELAVIDVLLDQFGP